MVCFVVLMSVSGGVHAGFDFPVQPVTQGILGNIEIVTGLQAHPELGRIAEVTRQAQRRISSDTAFAEHDLVDAAGMYANIQCQAALAHVHRLQEFFQKNFAGMDGKQFIFSHGNTFSGNPQSQLDMRGRFAIRSKYATGH
jgi:hypothetical protein